MGKIQTNKGVVSLPIIVGVIVVVVVVSGILIGRNDKETSKGTVSEIDTVSENTSIEVSTNEEVMGNEEEIESETDAKQTGSYEEYSPEKIAYAKNGKVVLFFHAGWCPTCRNQENNILKDLGSIPSNLTILKVDYDKEIELKKKYGITFQHTFVQVDAQGNAITKWSGGSTLGDVVKNIK